MKHVSLYALVASASLLFLAVLMDVSRATEWNNCGKASWYQLTTRTASGEYANPDKMTAAHRKLKFGTHVEVRNMRNNKTVIVRINDRGPFIKGRIIDVTRAAAIKLGFKNAGTTKVCYRVVTKEHAVNNAPKARPHTPPKSLPKSKPQKAPEKSL
ncbi:septal ring lytic transglycosylase RlpA family protein [Cohaesibacter sp. CAU 1516]|uniref:septal ring lytic transglycosylase RlpA family protein n=1 Tax=Cohaesibacter sp. CAU 1516 TaxID=2576038 RepID=UPI0010FD97DB|nr:septal ring lytic transglycosylase RlpA family protein [Cohaesibacter sp. CAU 1516]TLP48342.1 septal ring lytic transglycosylase RlpA family protein [Cohaesibacter sp. CAU 1516]